MSTAERTANPQASGNASDGPVLNRQVLVELVAMTGPDVAPELLRALQADLADVESRLQAQGAAENPDWDEVRAQSHVLVALAGSTGGQRLQLLAQDLNAVAHRQDRSGLAPTITDCLRLLTRFRRDVAQFAIARLDA